MRSDVRDVLAWDHHQWRHGSARWQGLCLSAARQAWGLPVLAPSARLWWEKIPHEHRHHARTAEQVPPGAMCYAPLGHWGHAWIMSWHGHAYSTDYHRRGHIDKVRDGALQHWTHTPHVWWTDWVPGHGYLPLHHR